MITKKDTLNWLLEDGNPSIRYFTLTEIMDRTEHDLEVQQSKKQIMQTNPVRKIFSTQSEEGYWGQAENFYVYAKYKGTTFTFLLLAELGANGNDDHILKTRDFLFKHSYDKQTGGFSFKCDKDGKALIYDVGPCLTGKMVWALIKLGFIHHPNTQKAINWLADYARCDDAISYYPKGYPYCNESGKPKQCWGKHTCYRNVFWRLKALSVIPPKNRTKKLEEVMDDAVDFILKHHIYKRSHNINEIMNKSWMSFTFPSFGEIDILQVLEVLTSLGYKEKRMNDSIKYLLSKQNESGRWILDKSLKGRIRATLEEPGMESKWITYRAIKTLKAWNHLAYK